VKYPNVYRSHIVPKGYLREFAVNEKIVAVNREGIEESKPIEKAGTRARHYRRDRPGSGEPIDDIEWSLSNLENVAIPALRTLKDTWPPDAEQKNKVATLFAYQLLRGPRWRAERGDHTMEFIQELRRTGRLDDEKGNARVLTPDEREHLDEVQAHLLGSTTHWTRMLVMGLTFSGVLASMHWTLVEFPVPLLVTSDDPVVIWPRYELARVPQPTPLTTGLLETLEVRAPISPTHLLLMTWSDGFDDDANHAKGKRHHAKNANAFTRAQADKQWFYMPGTAPVIGKRRRFPPISAELVKGYSIDAAANSRRRAAVAGTIKDGRDFSDREVTIVSITRKAKSGRVAAA
jgi:hypothetical protein